jgi:hypothetical protein
MVEHNMVIYYCDDIEYFGEGKKVPRIVNAYPDYPLRTLMDSIVTLPPVSFAYHVGLPPQQSQWNDVSRNIIIVIYLLLMYLFYYYYYYYYYIIFFVTLVGWRFTAPHS